MDKESGPDHQRLVSHDKKLALWEPLKNVVRE